MLSLSTGGRLGWALEWLLLFSGVLVGKPINEGHQQVKTASQCSGIFTQRSTITPTAGGTNTARLLATAMTTKYQKRHEIIVWQYHVLAPLYSYRKTEMRSGLCDDLGVRLPLLIRHPGHAHPAHQSVWWILHPHLRGR